jgi:hypothetical protein
MLLTSQKVMFRNYRRVASKKTGISADYIDAFEDKGEFSMSSKDVDLSKVEPLVPYEMTAEVIIRRSGIAMYIVVDKLSLKHPSKKGGEN